MTALAIIVAAFMLEHGITKAIDRLTAATERATQAAKQGERP